MQRRLQTNQRRQALYAAFVADVEADNFEDYLVEQIHELVADKDYLQSKLDVIREILADDDDLDRLECIA